MIEISIVLRYNTVIFKPTVITDNQLKRFKRWSDSHRNSYAMAEEIAEKLESMFGEFEEIEGIAINLIYKLYTMTSETIFIKMVLDAWHTHIKRTDELFNSLSDEQLMKEIAPGRNRGIYLLGHLAAVHDRMLFLLELGNPLHPELWEPFVERPDKEVTALPAIETLRKYWKEINTNLADNISSLSTEAWFQKHTSVSAEDFAKEPHRNKLNIIVNRTNHLANHLGQLLLLKSKN